MSRTIRRKSAKYLYYWELCDWSDSDAFLQRIRLDRKSAEGKRRIARFHSDAGFGDYAKACPPHWYRRMCNKKYDMEDKKRLSRFHNGFSEDAVPVSRRKNASWFW